MQNTCDTLLQVDIGDQEAHDHGDGDGDGDGCSACFPATITKLPFLPVMSKLD